MNYPDQSQELNGLVMPSEREFYFTVSYFGGTMPYLLVHESWDDALKMNKEGNIIYKIKIPTKKLS